MVVDVTVDIEYPDDGRLVSAEPFSCLPGSLCTSMIFDFQPVTSRSPSLSLWDFAG